MAKLIALVVIGVLTGCVHSSGLTRLPADAERVVSRLQSCTHFAGEINGDRSDRDREVTAAMTELHCETIERDVAAIRSKYPDNEAVQASLDAAGQL